MLIFSAVTDVMVFNVHMMCSYDSLKTTDLNSFAKHCDVTFIDVIVSKIPLKAVNKWRHLICFVFMFIQNKRESNPRPVALFFF
jgi:hypothetical protein